MKKKFKKCLVMVALVGIVFMVLGIPAQAEGSIIIKGTTETLNGKFVCWCNDPTPERNCECVIKR